MSIVNLSMRRPISTMVLVFAMVLFSVMAILKMPRDILPDLSLPVIYVAQPYGGLDPSQMESYITYYYEYHFLYIGGIENIESKSIQSTALIKLQFHQGTDMGQALAETVAEVNRSRAFMPNGTVPPFVVRFDAGSAPVGKLVFTSETRSLAELQNYALNYVRPIFATISGVSAPPPFGASARTIVVDIDPKKLSEYSLSADQVTNAILSSNLNIPSGNIHDGTHYPIVSVNGVVNDIQDLLDTPMRPGKNNPIFLRQIGSVRDGSDLATGYALVNGKRTVYIPVTKRSDASTLEVVDLVKESLPRFQAAIPEDVKVSYEFDQSGYVRRSISSLVMEAILGAILTGFMVLLFLKDLRSVFIVVLNIPLALLSAMVGLWISGQTVNIMTLGGLALAVGILVDETTVTIENIHSHLATGVAVDRATADGTNEILKPALLTLLCVLSVFMPSFFMAGVTHSLFIPLTLSVGFSMISSFFLSRTVVPVMCVWLLKGHPHSDEGFFDKIKAAYAKILKVNLQHPKKLIFTYLVVATVTAGFCLLHIGGEIFPQADANQFQVRLRLETGMAIDETEKATLDFIQLVKDMVGKENVESTVAFVGTQPSNYAVNNIHLWTSGPQEAVLEVAFNENGKLNIPELKEKIRKKVKETMPGMLLSFEPTSLVDRTMNSGGTTPIEVAVTGKDIFIDRALAEKLKTELDKLPYLRDLQFGQRLHFPVIQVEVNRREAGYSGVSVAQVGNAVVPATSSSRFIAQDYWSDPKSGINYQVQVEVPEKLMTSLKSVQDIPLPGLNGDAVPLSKIATVTHTTKVGEYDRWNMQRMVTLTANLYGMDLGHAARDINKIVAKIDQGRPRGTEIHLRGQLASFSEMFKSLSVGLCLAIVIIFLLLAANFESISLAFVILATVPAVLAGALGFLMITGSTLNIESFMGSIMAIGVSVANAILVVTFSERQRLLTGNAAEAALEGAKSRLRPIMMTSMAMLVGMMPMSLGLGEGGEQTAPLGRAVIGGLAASTFTTLFILPLLFGLIQKNRGVKSNSLDPDDAERMDLSPKTT
jgi:multidrug efflux pump subunit AcrB